MLVAVIPRQKLPKRVSEFARLEIQTRREPGAIAQISLQNSDGCGLAQARVVVVQALEVVDSSFVNCEQAGSQTVRSQKSGLTIQPPTRARITPTRAPRAR